MTNKVNLRKDIFASNQLTRQIKDKDYPIELLDITFEVTRRTSNLKQLSKPEIQTIFEILFNVIKTTIKKKINFITHSIEVETVSLGDHIITFSVNVIGRDIREYRPKLNGKISQILLEKMGGNLIIKHSKLDRISLLIELIPLQLDLLSFIEAINSNKEDKVFYSDDILEYIFDGLKTHSITRTK
jgi:hypothetical protein